MRLKLYKKESDKKILRAKCIEKSFVEGKLVAHQLLKALHFGTLKSKAPVGLASNQMGLNCSVFIAKLGDEWTSFINPRLEKHSKKTVESVEGCLSLKPNKQFMTNRYEWVQISYLESEDTRVHHKFNGFESIIIQHELDHLNGKLCKDGGINE